MAVAYATATEGTFNNVTDWSLAVPTDTAVGDLLICFAGNMDTVPGTFAGEAGWTAGQTSEAAADSTLAWAWKIADSGDTSGSIAFTWTLASTGAAVLIRYTGAHATTPINAGFSLVTQASSTTYTSPEITPSVDNCLIVTFATNDGNTGHANPQYSAWTNSATERHDFRDAVEFETMGVADFTQGSAAAITGAVTRGNADIGVMGIVAIAPVAAAGDAVMPYIGGGYY